MDLLTVGDTKGCTSTHIIVLELVVEETEECNQQMEENPDSKEKLPTTLIDRPKVHLLAKSFGLLRLAGCARVRSGPLQTLQPPPLCLITR